MMRKSSKPVIGITSPVKGGEILWQCSRLAIWLSGGIPRKITHQSTKNLDKYQGFIISGGSDINPQLYGEAALFGGGKYDIERDTLEQRIIRHAYTHDRPLLGICRGMQLLSVTFEGSLYQDASNVLEDFLPNDNLISKMIGRRKVAISDDSQLFKILGGYPSYNVNSIHHQAVNDVGTLFRVVAKEENGLVQAIEMADSARRHTMLMGVQWHPELMIYVPSARRIFAELVRQARSLSTELSTQSRNMTQ